MNLSRTWRLLARAQATTQGGLEAALPLDLHQARAAGTHRSLIRILAQVRHVCAHRVDGVEHRRALGDGDAAAIDGKRDAHFVMILADGGSAQPRSHPDVPYVD